MFTWTAKRGADAMLSADLAEMQIGFDDFHIRDGIFVRVMG